MIGYAATFFPGPRIRREHVDAALAEANGYAISASGRGPRSGKARYVLRAEIAGSLYNLPSGSPMPALDVQLGTESTSLNALCGEEAPMVIFFSSRSCSACEELKPVWTAAATTHQRVRFVQVHLDGLPASRGVGSRIVDVSARGASVIAEVGVRRVPAMLAAGGDCSVEALGSGYEASRAVLERLGRSSVSAF